MRKFLLILVLCFACKNSPNYDFSTRFETSNGLETVTYEEIITFYSQLAEVYNEISLEAIGETDAGKPLHLVTFNPDAEFNYETIREDKRILLINNGIHPGEPDGIDATMLLFRDLAQGNIKIPENVVIASIPIYNIGGSLNRNSNTRTNQNGPKAYGFRGNARNYDLNRDFIKCDTKNAKTFAEIFHLLKPDVFIDTHVSNGADYQYTLTHLFTQHNKLGDKLGIYLHTEMMPKLEKKLNEKDLDITPYVNVFNRTPEQGFSQFMDYPRYSTGYTTLFNTLGMMIETHMLKPYKQRVEGTYEILKSMIKITDSDSDKIKSIREEMPLLMHKNKYYTLDWAVDTTKASILNFKGYEADVITSEVTGFKRLKYNRTKPFVKEVNYQNYYEPKLKVEIPSAYIIPQGWHNVIALLKLNEVEMIPLKNDSIITVESYRIKGYKTRKSPYEGHYPHYDVKISISEEDRQFSKGDYFINTNQNTFRYLMATLEPQAPDSFFNWNFFDTILQQKEGFSPYVWEDKALELLQNNPQLKQEFEHRKQDISEFKDNWYAQLDWLHKQSKHYEEAHLLYPVFRIK
ncbi:hypothetical protein EYD45_04630 [Hyunsoonleella flava]|uniref:Peptidase M14 carboxypeptidase A domain-containing protein n=1 Tax=Hyunsoonleella flava TaxID=2527939 RepID=A0A4Q9FG24_9FLAO|nr:M14 family metallopeptidase [Hyunsoonleella flava]TBN05567.1 hypothetical protein EYD45_04630 [Hyunsoonleella flava]